MGQRCPKMANLTPCWPLFPQNVGSYFLVHPVFCWIYVLFRFFGRPGPLLAPFGLDLGRSGARFSEVLGSILQVSGDNLGIRLLLENLLFRSILLAFGSGWASGVTRSAKNFCHFAQKGILIDISNHFRRKTIFSVFKHPLGAPW